jgi:hypothetical protein
LLNSARAGERQNRPVAKAFVGGVLYERLLRQIIGDQIFTFAGRILDLGEGQISRVLRHHQSVF